MDAFDADVVIYAASPGHYLGEAVRRLFPDDPTNGEAAFAGVGSVLLLPEVLAKPTASGASDEVAALTALLARLDLRPVDETIAVTYPADLA